MQIDPFLALGRCQEYVEGENTMSRHIAKATTTLCTMRTGRGNGGTLGCDKAVLKLTGAAWNNFEIILVSLEAISGD